jgi:hypothetical protein
VPRPRTKGRLGPQYRTRHPRITSAQRRRRAPSGAAAFSPSQLATLDFWYDATRIEGLADDGEVSTWADLSANADNLTAGAAPAVYKTGILNGLPVVRFVPSDELNATTITARTAQTMYLVITKRTAPGTDTTQGVRRNASTAARLGASSIFNATNWYWAHNEAASNVNTGITANAWHIIVLNVASAASMTIRAEGGAATASFDPLDAVTTGTAVRLGGANADFDIAEIIGVGVSHTTTEMDTVGEYLADKWGFTWVATS